MNEKEIEYHVGVVKRLVELYLRTQKGVYNPPETEDEWNNLMDLVLKDMQDMLNTES